MGDSKLLSMQFRALHSLVPTLWPLHIVLFGLAPKPQILWSFQMRQALLCAFAHSRQMPGMALPTPLPLQLTLPETQLKCHLFHDPSWPYSPSRIHCSILWCEYIITLLTVWPESASDHSEWRRSLTLQLDNKLIEDRDWALLLSESLWHSPSQAMNVLFI